jgi:TetR/AcrR family fatty acid metabolism transcriptional regulator
MTLAEAGRMETGQASDTRRRILAAAVDIIDSHGEAALRMADVARQANVAIGLVGHYFGGRDGLVAAAQAERFSGTVIDDLARLHELVGDRRSRSDVHAALSALTRELIGPARERRRLARIAALGAAHGRPELRDQLSASVGDLLDVFTTIVMIGQEEGYVRPDLDPRGIATLVQGYALGLVLADLDPRAAPPEALAEVIDAAMSCLLVVGKHDDTSSV